MRSLLHGGPSVAEGDHLRHRMDRPGDHASVEAIYSLVRPRPPAAAIHGLGDISWQENAVDGPEAYFGGDHWWHDRSRLLGKHPSMLGRKCTYICRILLLIAPTFNLVFNVHVPSSLALSYTAIMCNGPFPQ